MAVTAAVPTVGLAVTSVVVGAAAGTESALEETRSKWNRKLLGFGSILLLAVDPQPASYISGITSITFPNEYLQFQGLTWFGPFSDGSTGDLGPVAGSGAVQGSGFTDDVPLFVQQPANSSLDVNTNVSGGVLTVSWSTDPAIQADGDPVNIFGAVFTSIWPQDLQFGTAPAGAPANLFQNITLQSVICIPSDETQPRQCGYPDEPIGFTVTPVPIPAALPLFATGVGAVAYAGRRRKAAQAAA
jgi:hypothetical protein